MAELSKADILRMLSEIQDGILLGWDEAGEARPVCIPDPIKPFGKKEAIQHALYCMERGFYIANEGKEGDLQNMISLAVCIGAACGVVLPFGIVAQYKIPLFDIAVAINLPSFSR